MPSAVPLPSGHLADRLLSRTGALGHPLCVGLDPHLDQLPEPFRAGTMALRDPATAQAVEAFSNEVIDRLEGRVAAIKPQSAFFEQLGAPGIAVLARVLTRCRQRGLSIILDAKRGDIGSTARAYARAYLGCDAPMAADALTVNPYLGLETLEPFLEAAAPVGAGIFVLVKTSNRGSRDLQELESDGRKVYQRLATGLAPLADELVGASGFSSLGIVVGATYPDEARRLREQLPRSLMLVPGYGAQGASAEDAVAGFVTGEGHKTGGLVNASRSILFPAKARPWAAGFEAALTRSIDELATAVARS